MSLFLLLSGLDIYLFPYVSRFLIFSFNTERIIIREIKSYRSGVKESTLNKLTSLPLPLDNLSQAMFFHHILSSGPGSLRLPYLTPSMKSHDYCASSFRPKSP